MAGSRIDLAGLQKELDGFRARVERWAAGVCAGSEAARDAHYQRIREFQATLRGLEQQQDQLERRAEEVQQREWLGGAGPAPGGRAAAGARQEPSGGDVPQPLPRWMHGGGGQSSLAAGSEVRCYCPFSGTRRAGERGGRSGGAAGRAGPGAGGARRAAAAGAGERALLFLRPRTPSLLAAPQACAVQAAPPGRSREACVLTNKGAVTGGSGRCRPASDYCCPVD